LEVRRTVLGNLEVGVPPGVVGVVEEVTLEGRDSVAAPSVVAVVVVAAGRRQDEVTVDFELFVVRVAEAEGRHLVLQVRRLASAIVDAVDEDRRHRIPVPHEAQLAVRQLVEGRELP